jgi:TolB protein
MSMRRRRWPPLALAFALVVGTQNAGCDSSPTDTIDPVPDHGLIVEAAGRLERGLRLQLALIDTTTADADPAGEPPVWTADPADAVEFLAVDDTAVRAEGGMPETLGTIQARLLRAGTVTITATAGERSGRLTLEVAAPPTVVFEMVRGGNRDIYRAALDGGDLVRLTSGQHDNRSPTVGSGRVVFVSYRDGNGELYSVPLAGGAETRLTRTGPQEADPALSPDGKRLAYTNAATGVPKLWTAAADASEAAHATLGFGFAGSLEASPSWAPDGERLVFVSTTQGTADLFLYTRATGAVTPLLGTDAPEVEPAWSPDGEWIAFTSARAGQTDIFRLRVGTGEVEQLTNRQETDARPAWLADGRMVYIAWVDNVPRLRWLDPVDPAMVHEVPLGGGTVGRVSAVW